MPSHRGLSEAQAATQQPRSTEGKRDRRDRETASGLPCPAAKCNLPRRAVGPGRRAPLLPLSVPTWLLASRSLSGSLRSGFDSPKSSRTTQRAAATKAACSLWSGQVRFITRPKSRTMRAKRKNVRERTEPLNEGAQMSDELESERAMVVIELW